MSDDALNEIAFELMVGAYLVQGAARTRAAAGLRGMKDMGGPCAGSGRELEIQSQFSSSSLPLRRVDAGDAPLGTDN